MTFIRVPAMLAAVAAALVLCACAPPENPRLATLEQRVQQLQDEKAIREVVIRYGEYLDARDYAGYASLFASDGVWTGGFGSAKGPAAIQEMLEKTLKKAEAGFINKSNFHLMTTVVVDVDGDTAKVRSRYMFVTASPENRPVPALAGRYVDDFVRENGAWKIKNRTTHGVIPYRDGNAPIQPPDPVLGSWKLNVEKSKFTPGPGWQSQTRVYQSTPVGVSVTWTGIGASGEKMQVSYTYQYDGKDYPMTGSASYDTLNAVRIDALTVKSEEKRGGKTVGIAMRSVSADGKVLTLTDEGTNRKGRKFSQVLVFDRQ
jgi:uncharacterized protein (TIGR02246 family)